MSGGSEFVFGVKAKNEGVQSGLSFWTRVFCRPWGSPNYNTTFKTAGSLLSQRYFFMST